MLLLLLLFHVIIIDVDIGAVVPMLNVVTNLPLQMCQQYCLVSRVQGT